jgi:oligosaccharide repeat unit polymerase
LGFSFGYKSNKVSNDIKYIDLNLTNKLLTNKLTTIILALIVLVLSYFSKKYIDYIIVVGAIEAREARFFTGKVFQSGIEIAAFTYIIVPLVWFSMFLFSYCTIYNKYKNINWALSFLIIILYASFGAGRNIFIETSLIMLLIYSAKKSNYTENNKSNKIILILLIILFIILSVLATAFRSDSLSDLTIESFIDAFEILTENFFIYFLGSIRAFQHAFNNPNQYFQYSFGLLTLSGINELFSYTLKFSGFSIEPYSWKFGPTLFEEIRIGSNHDFNALYSAVYNFYFDFDLLGVILFGWIFGNLCSIAVNKFLNTSKPEYFFISSILFTCSIWSILNWKLQSGEFIVMTIAPLIFTNLKKVRILKNHE